MLFYVPFFRKSLEIRKRFLCVNLHYVTEFVIRHPHSLRGNSRIKFLLTQNLTVRLGSRLDLSPYIVKENPHVTSARTRRTLHILSRSISRAVIHVGNPSAERLRRLSYNAPVLTGNKEGRRIVYSRFPFHSVRVNVNRRRSASEEPRNRIPNRGLLLDNHLGSLLRLAFGFTLDVDVNLVTPIRSHRLGNTSHRFGIRLLFGIRILRYIALAFLLSHILLRFGDILLRFDILLLCRTAHRKSLGNTLGRTCISFSLTALNRDRLARRSHIRVHSIHSTCIRFPESHTHILRRLGKFCPLGSSRSTLGSIL